jgi:NitT/TauT family transport system substrate-binding protein
MSTRGTRSLLVVLALLLWSGAAAAQTKMTIATGVDPVFSAYYVAQEEGLFKKHGLDVRINTGPSGSAMVSFLVNGQIESAFGSEIAGIANHNLDPNVVVVAQAARLVRWIAVVGRNIDNLDQLKGKKVGIARGSGGEVFWLAMIAKLKLNPADYTVVNVEAPEMVAALERGNIDAYAVWEPWVTRGLAAVKNTKVLKDQEGILEQGVFIYMNQGWIKKNPAAAVSFVGALADATDVINKDRKRAAKDVSDFLKSLDPPMVEQLMTKLTFDMELSDTSLAMLRLAESQLKQQGKLAKPVDYGAFVYPELLRSVQPKAVTSRASGASAWGWSSRSRPAPGRAPSRSGRHFGSTRRDRDEPAPDSDRRRSRPVDTARRRCGCPSDIRAGRRACRATGWPSCAARTRGGD